jgi:hypothetical protein
MPESAPSATARSSTLRVEMPWTQVLHQHRIQGLVDPAAGFEDGREERALPQFRDPQLDVAGLGRQQLRAGTVAFGHPVLAAFIAVGADHPGGFELDQLLQHDADRLAIMSTPSPVRNASSNSDGADWDKAIGGSPSVCLLVVTHRRSRRWPPTSRSPAAGPQTPPPQGTLLFAVAARRAANEAGGDLERPQRDRFTLSDVVEDNSRATPMRRSGVHIPKAAPPFH